MGEKGECDTFMAHSPKSHSTTHPPAHSLDHTHARGHTQFPFHLKQALEGVTDFGGASKAERSKRALLGRGEGGGGQTRLEIKITEGTPASSATSAASDFGLTIRSGPLVREKRGEMKEQGG